MIEKKCTKCGDTKPVSGFHKQSRHKSGYKSSCKDCRKKESLDANRKRRELEYIRNNHKPCVYILPNEMWVGTTENLKNRLNAHKYADKRDVLNARVLREFDTRSDALEFEEFMHELGYKGKHKNNRYV